jgi:hypothetical protein
MTAPQSTTTTEPSLGRDVLNAARYYLGNRWVLLALGSVAVIAGLSFGGWGLLVAAGLAPVILSMLPCLVMCGLGVCVMCRSGKTQSTASLDAADSTTSSSAPGVARMERPIAGGSCGCHEQAAEVPPPQVKQLQPTEERRGSHA